MTVKTTHTQPEQPVTKKATIGKKAYEAIRCTIRASFRHTTGASNMKGQRAWLPKFLIHTDDGGFFVPVNENGLVVGEINEIEITPDWLIPREMVEAVEDLVYDRNGNVLLYEPHGSPWLSEWSKAPYLERVGRICGIDTAALHRESCRPQPRFIV